MGLKHTVDYLNFIPDKALADIPGLQKSIDYVLASEKQCSQYNIIMSPCKFQASTLKKYGGFIIISKVTNVKILSDDENFVKILDFPTQTSKMGAMELMGLVRVCVVFCVL